MLFTFFLLLICMYAYVYVRVRIMKLRVTINVRGSVKINVLLSNLYNFVRLSQTLPRIYVYLPNLSAVARQTARNSTFLQSQQDCHASPTLPRTLRPTLPGDRRKILVPAGSFTEDMCNIWLTIAASDRIHCRRLLCSLALRGGY